MSEIGRVISGNPADAGYSQDHSVEQQPTVQWDGKALRHDATLSEIGIGQAFSHPSAALDAIKDDRIMQGGGRDDFVWVISRIESEGDLKGMWVADRYATDSSFSDAELEEIDLQTLPKGAIIVDADGKVGRVSARTRAPGLSDLGAQIRGERFEEKILKGLSESGGTTSPGKAFDLDDKPVGGFKLRP